MTPGDYTGPERRRGGPDRREPGAMKDFVGVGIADAAEDVWIGERALQGVVFRLERPAERGTVRVEHLEPAAVVHGEPPRAAAPGPPGPAGRAGGGAL